MPTHMILRHIERWPVRAILTSFGVATATMLLIGLLFFFDSIDELVDGFYFRSNRQDIVIGLLDQQSERLRFDIARLPGVLAAEPTLDLAARSIRWRSAAGMRMFKVSRGAALVKGAAVGFMVHDSGTPGDSSRA